MTVTSKVQITGIEQVNAIFGTIAPTEAKNLLRVTTFDMAKQAAVIAKTNTPDDPATGVGDLKSSIKGIRGKGSRNKVEASVNVTNIRRNFFWRFLEYGDGPDNVEHAMFGRTIEALRPIIVPMYLRAFGAALEKRLARLRK